MTATCSVSGKAGSNVKTTELDFSICSELAGANELNGRLVCAAPNWGFPGGMPGGTWNKICSLASLSGGMLRAVCNLPKYQLSAVNLTLCSPGATLSVAQGQLICSSLAAGVPTGSYSNSCSPLQWNGTFLTAQCSGNNGTQTSTLQLSTCSSNSGISEFNSQLQCSAMAAGVPGGSWNVLCAATAYNSTSGILSAVCQPNNQHTYLNYSLCASRAQVKQSEGVLICSSFVPQLPGGSWLSSCAPYSYSSGGLLSAWCSTTLSGAIVNSFLNMNACGDYNSALEGQGVSLSQSYGAIVC